MASSRRISPILFCHVLKEFLLPLVCAVLAFAFLFMVNNIFDDLQDFMSHDAPLSQFVLYLLALQPHHLLNIVPISILLAASFMTVMLGKNNELCAMRTAGLSLAACALPLWIFAAGATILVAIIGESWGQSALDYATSIQARYCGLSKKNKVPIAFSNPIQNRDWALTPAGDGRSFNDAVIRQFDKDGGTLWLLAAKKASTDLNGNWTFEGAMQESYDPNGTVEKVVSSPVLTMQLEEHPADFKTFSDKHESISLRQVMTMLNRPVALPDQTVHRLKTIFWYNLTFPLACMVAALFGFSMTIANQRSEIMRGFACAVGMLVLFYIVGQVMFVMGKNGWMPPFIAGALPSLAFTAGGVANVWRKR